jgi:hypothetical protein
MKSNKVIYSILIVCLELVTTLITFPIISEQSFAQTQKGTCASAAQKEAQIRPVIEYTRLPINVNGDNRYFVFVYRPDNYNKNIELKVDGLQSWWIEELKPNIASMSGGSVIVKSSGSFIIHGTPVPVSCICKPASPQSAKDVCSSGCINAGVDCQVGCKSSAGVKLTPTDSAIKTFGFDNGRDFLTVIGMTQNQIQGLTDEQISLQFYASTAAMFGLLDSQIFNSKPPLVFADNVEITQILANGQEISYGTKPAQQAIDFVHQNLFIQDRAKECHAYLLSKTTDGRISKMVVMIGLDPNDATKTRLVFADGFSHVPLRDGLTAIRDSKSYEYFQRFLKDDYVILGYTHSQNAPYVDVGDIVAGVKRAMPIYKKLYTLSLVERIKNVLQFWREEPIIYVMGYDPATKLFSVNVVDANKGLALENYGIAKYGNSQYLEMADGTGGWGRWPLDEAARKGFPTNGVLSDSVISVLITPSSVNSAVMKNIISKTGNNFYMMLDELARQAKEANMEFVQAKNLGQDTRPAGLKIIAIKAALLELESIVPRDYAGFSRTNQMVYATIYDIKDLLGIPDEAKPIIVRIIDDVTKIKEKTTEGMLTSQKEALDDVVKLEKEGKMASSDAHSQFTNNVDKLSTTMDKSNQALNDPSMRKIAESAGAEKDPVGAAKASAKWGPLIVGIGLTLSQAVSPDLRAYGQKIQNSNYILAANIIDAAGWVILGTSITTTAASLLGVTVPSALVTYFSLGATVEQIVSGLVSGSLVGAIVTTVYETGKQIICSSLDPNNPLCSSSCSPDPLYGTMQLELERNYMKPGEKVNFVLYGMQNCNRQIGKVTTLKQISQNQYQTDKVIGDCGFKEYDSGVVKMLCCEGQIGRTCNTQSGGCIDVALDNGNYKIAGNLNPTDNTLRAFGTNMQDFAVGNEPPTTTTTLSATKCCCYSSSGQVSCTTGCQYDCSGSPCNTASECTATTTIVPSACSQECANKGYTNAICRTGNICYPGEQDIGQDGCGSSQKCCCSSAAPPPHTLQCTKENDKSWICQSSQNKIECTRDTSASRLTWNCQIV